MVYGIGILGFIAGFIAGQMLLYFMLRHKTKEELLNDPYIKWKYGLLNWGVAALGAYSFVAIYKEYAALM
jgi:hypothetical protein